LTCRHYQTIDGINLNSFPPYKCEKDETVAQAIEKAIAASHVDHKKAVKQFGMACSESLTIHLLHAKQVSNAPMYRRELCIKSDACFASGISVLYSY